MMIQFYTCDHCGKKLDDMKDYPDCVIDVCYNTVQCDLCADCVSKLGDLVVGFVKAVADRE